MAVDAPQKEPSGGKKKGLRRPKRRIAVRIDMTPMVDIAFLLLIFYMVTTVFAMPQAMEINLPPKSDDDQGERTKVKKSNLLDVYVDKNGDIYYDIGKALDTGEDIKVPRPITADSLRTLFIRYNWDRPKLNTLLIIHPDAPYSRMIDLLDEIEVAEALLRNNEEFMKTYLAANPDFDSFSFRYSLDHWSRQYDRRMARAHGETGGGDE